MNPTMDPNMNPLVKLERQEFPANNTYIFRTADSSSSTRSSKSSISLQDNLQNSYLECIPNNSKSSDMCSPKIKLEYEVEESVIMEGGGYGAKEKRVLRKRTILLEPKQEEVDEENIFDESLKMKRRSTRITPQKKNIEKKIIKKNTKTKKENVVTPPKRDDESDRKITFPLKILDVESLKTIKRVMKAKYPHKTEDLNTIAQYEDNLNKSLKTKKKPSVSKTQKGKRKPSKKKKVDLFDPIESPQKREPSSQNEQQKIDANNTHSVPQNLCTSRNILKPMGIKTYKVINCKTNKKQSLKANDIHQKIILRRCRSGASLNPSDGANIQVIKRPVRKKKILAKRTPFKSKFNKKQNTNTKNQRTIKTKKYFIKNSNDLLHCFTKFTYTERQRSILLSHLQNSELFQGVNSKINTNDEKACCIKERNGVQSSSQLEKMTGNEIMDPLKSTRTTNLDRKSEYMDENAVSSTMFQQDNESTTMDLNGLTNDLELRRLSQSRNTSTPLHHNTSNEDVDKQYDCFLTNFEDPNWASDADCKESKMCKDNSLFEEDFIDSIQQTEDQNTAYTKNLDAANILGPLDRPLFEHTVTTTANRDDLPLEFQEMLSKRSSSFTTTNNVPINVLNFNEDVNYNLSPLLSLSEYIPSSKTLMTDQDENLTKNTKSLKFTYLNLTEKSREFVDKSEHVKVSKSIDKIIKTNIEKPDFNDCAHSSPIRGSVSSIKQPISNTNPLDFHYMQSNPDIFRFNELCTNSLTFDTLCSTDNNHKADEQNKIVTDHINIYPIENERKLVKRKLDESDCDIPRKKIRRTEVKEKLVESANVVNSCSKMKDSGRINHLNTENFKKIEYQKQDTGLNSDKDRQSIETTNLPKSSKIIPNKQLNFETRFSQEFISSSFDIEFGEHDELSLDLQTSIGGSESSESVDIEKEFAMLISNSNEDSQRQGGAVETSLLKPPPTEHKNTKNSMHDVSFRDLVDDIVTLCDMSTKNKSQGKLSSNLKLANLTDINKEQHLFDWLGREHNYITEDFSKIKDIDNVRNSQCSDSESEFESEAESDMISLDVSRMIETPESDSEEDHNLANANRYVAASRDRVVNSPKKAKPNTSIGRKPIVYDLQDDTGNNDVELRHRADSNGNENNNFKSNESNFLSDTKARTENGNFISASVLNNVADKPQVLQMNNLPNDENSHEFQENFQYISNKNLPFSGNLSRSNLVNNHQHVSNTSRFNTPSQNSQPGNIDNPKNNLPLNFLLQGPPSDCFNLLPMMLSVPPPTCGKQIYQQLRSGPLRPEFDPEFLERMRDQEEQPVSDLFAPNRTEQRNRFGQRGYHHRGPDRRSANFRRSRGRFGGNYRGSYESNQSHQERIPRQKVWGRPPPPCRFSGPP